MPGRAVKTQKHAVTGKYVSAKSKTGNPQCSQAMSTWVRGRSSGSVPAEVFAILGKCRAQAHALKSGHLQRVAGNEARAQVLEHRAATGKVGAKNRSELAARLREQRAAKQTASKPSLKAQVQAHREKMGIADPNVRLRKSIDLKQGLNAKHERLVHEKDKYIDSVHKDLTTRSQDLRDTSGAKYLKSSAEKALGDRNRLAKERGLPERGPLDFKPKAIKRTVHEAIHELSGGKPGTKVSIDKLKSHIKNVHKKEIDTALQHLAKKGQVTIHDGKHVAAQRPPAPFDRAAEAKRLIERRKTAKSAQAKPAVPSRATPERQEQAQRLRGLRSTASQSTVGGALGKARPSERLSASELVNRRKTKYQMAINADRAIGKAQAKSPKEAGLTHRIHRKAIENFTGKGDKEGGVKRAAWASDKAKEAARSRLTAIKSKKFHESLSPQEKRYARLGGVDPAHMSPEEISGRLALLRKKREEVFGQKIKAREAASSSKAAVPTPSTINPKPKGPKRVTPKIEGTDRHSDTTRFRLKGSTIDHRKTLKNLGAIYEPETKSYILSKADMANNGWSQREAVQRLQFFRRQGIKITREKSLRNSPDPSVKRKDTTRIVIRGNTYNVKDLLKKMGATFNGINWEFHKDNLPSDRAGLKKVARHIRTLRSWGLDVYRDSPIRFEK